MYRWIILAALGLLSTVTPLSAAPGDNLLPHPGFEQLQGEAITGWTNPDYWSGRLSSVSEAHGGGRAASLEATEKAGRVGGRVHSSVVPVAPGLGYEFFVWAKGSGSLKLGTIFYIPKVGDNPHYRTTWQDTGTVLGPDWRQVSLRVGPVEPDVLRVAMMIEVEGEGAVALLDDAALVVTRQIEGFIRGEPLYQMVPAGGLAELRIEAVAQGPLPASGMATVAVASGEQASVSRIALDAEGRAVFRLPAESTAEPCLEAVTLAQTELGSAVTAYVEVVSEELYSRFERAATGARIPERPAHLLFLGDSLTDFSRGHNYVDQVGFWLQQTVRGDISVKNAGVGGDYITRVWDRLSGDPRVYRLAAYDGLYEPVPTRVFLFLGHNDSKQTSGSGFTESMVASADFDRLYRRTVEKIRADTGARLTLISSTSSVFEITEPMARSALEKRGSASLFGRPETLEQFNAIARKVAEDLGCDYIDVYEPTRTHTDKPSLFTQDGVHLTQAGNQVVALCVLEALAR
jgi:lysophospholipase L1-like esterase